MEKDKKQSEGWFEFFAPFLKWKIEEKELKKQIENYDTLGFFRSARKVATVLLLFNAIILLIFIMVGWLFSLAWVDIVFILILAFFVYRGKKWAMVITMIYWTISRAVQAFNAPNRNFLLDIIWWSVVMGAFWQAYQVERARSKILKEKPIQGDQKKEEKERGELKTLEDSKV